MSLKLPKTSVYLKPNLWAYRGEITPLVMTFSFSSSVSESYLTIQINLHSALHLTLCCHKVYPCANTNCQYLWIFKQVAPWPWSSLLFQRLTHSGVANVCTNLLRISISVQHCLLYLLKGFLETRLHVS